MKRLLQVALALLFVLAVRTAWRALDGPGTRGVTPPMPEADIASLEAVQQSLDSAIADSTTRDERVSELLSARMPNTYLGELLAAHDSMNFRWRDRQNERLRVWVEDVNPTRPEFARRIVAAAFEDWRDSGIPVAFSIVLDSARAEVRVTWVEKFDTMMTGLTSWTTNNDGWIVAAGIKLARHQPDGRVLDDQSLAAIARHEVGHLLGLDHTSDPTSIMAARVRVFELSEADRRTVRLVYALPPGRMPLR